MRKGYPPTEFEPAVFGLHKRLNVELWPANVKTSQFYGYQHHSKSKLLGLNSQN